jgi:hypothetical protein
VTTMLARVHDVSGFEEEGGRVVLVKEESLNLGGRVCGKWAESVSKISPPLLVKRERGGWDPSFLVTRSPTAASSSRRAFGHANVEEGCSGSIIIGTVDPGQGGGRPARLVRASCVPLCLTALLGDVCPPSWLSWALLPALPHTTPGTRAAPLPTAPTTALLSRRSRLRTLPRRRR